MLLRPGMGLALWGTLMGAAAALGLTQSMTSLLFGTKAHDRVTFLSVAILLVLTALSACALAARRAAGMDPMQALRCE